MSDPSLNVWIARLEGLRQTDPLVSRGAWRGYKGDESGPLKGEFVAVRLRAPNIAVSHDDPDEVLRVARLIEEAL